jgi:peptide/nickel transport system substrate-binding protein
MRLRPVAFAIAALTILGACSSDRTGGDGGGTVIVGLPADPSTLFPLLVFDEAGRAVTDVLFDKLAAISPRLSAVGDAGFSPRLAKSWDWSADSLTIAFHLDPAARFHDGTPVTAGDVRYSFQVAKDTLSGSPLTQLITNIDSVTVVDSLTAKFWYAKRSPTQFFDAVYQITPVPEHVYGKVAVADLRTSDVTRTPVGTGRFRFMKWEPGVSLEIVADTANYRGRAKLDRVIFMQSPSPTTAAASLLAGQMDFYSAFPIDQVDQLDSSSVVHAVPYLQNGYAFLGMNLYDGKNTSRPHPILGDIAVRRAISMALDRQSMLTNVFKTTGRIAYGPFPTGAELGDTTLAPPAYDTTAAKAALDAAGWRVGPGGVRTKNGRPLALEIGVPTSSLIRLRYAELIQEQLNRVGFKAEVNRVPPPQFAAILQQSFDYDMLLLTVNTDPSVAGVAQMWGSAGIPSGSNWMRYRSRDVDVTLDSAGRMLDGAALKRYTSRAFKRIIDDAPAVWLFSSGTMAAANRRIDLEPFPLDGWWNSLADWSIPADKRIDRDKIGLRPATP